MSNPTFVVTVKVGGESASKTWNSENELTIGHPIRWVLERNEKGVTVKNTHDGSTREIEEGKLEKGASFELPEKDAKTGFTVELKMLELLPPAYTTHEGEGELHVYALRGLWTMGSETILHQYTGEIEGQKAFGIKKLSNGKYQLTAYTKGIHIENGKTSVELRGHTTFDRDSLHDAVIRSGEFTWKIESQKQVQAPKLVAVAAADDASFKRTLQGSVAASILIALMSFLMPKHEIPQPQQTKILFTKKLVHGAMTAAAQGDSSARDTSQGNNAHAKNPRGSDLPAVGKKQAKRPHVAKTVAHKSPVKAQPKSVAKHVAKPQAHKAVTHAKAAPAAKPTHVSKAKPTVVGKPKVVAKAQGADLSKTAIGKLLQANSFKNVTRGLQHGGVANLDARHSGSGSAIGSLSHGSTALDETAGVARGASFGSKNVQVSGLGGSGTGGAGGKGLGYGRGSHAAVNGQGKSFVSLDTSASDVAEGLTKDQVGRVIHAHMSEIRYCYESAMLRQPDVEGKLALNFVINGGGTVKRAGVNQSTLADAALDDCVMKRLVRWQFPHPRGGVDVAVNYPFVFKTLGR